jgi:hypothetical protein
VIYLTGHIVTVIIIKLNAFFKADDFQNTQGHLTLKVGLHTVNSSVSISSAEDEPIVR